MSDPIKPYHPARNWLWLDKEGGKFPHQYAVVINGQPVAWFSNLEAARHTADAPEYYSEPNIVIVTPFEEIVVRRRKVA